MNLGQPESHEHAVGNAAFVLALRERGVRDTAVLRAMEQVPREAFAPAPLRAHARSDMALPLPVGQSMTAPAKIAAMLTALEIVEGVRVLEVGTGSGYATALLLQLGAGEVVSLERSAILARAACINLGVRRGLHVVFADGLDATFAGEARFDRILVNGMCPEPPAHLSAALSPGGRLVCAVGKGAADARLTVVTRADDGSLARREGRPISLPALLPGIARVL